jgi:hypothetical protein
MMSTKWIRVAILAWAGACAPVAGDELAGEAEEGAYVSDDEEPTAVEVKQQAVTFDVSCTQGQRDVLGSANFFVWALANDALTNWSAHASRRARWFNASIFVDSPTLRSRVRAIHDLALAGGPTQFFCPSSCPGTGVGIALPSQGRIILCPHYWTLAHGAGDSAEPVPGGFPPGSQVGVLAHEYAHYIGAPLDIALGPTACRALALQSSAQAFKNADNWRMYLMGL